MKIDTKLTVISEPYSKLYGKFNRIFVLCKCSCGNITEILLSKFRNKHTRSCGCLHKEATIKLIKFNTKHNLTYHPLYSIWRDIKNRCYNNKCKEYKYYGQRGIILSKEWLDNFQNFYDWAVQNGWEKGLEIDRINNNGNYESNNCKFSTNKEQSNNRRNNHHITAFGETKTLAEWADDPRCKVKAGTLLYRINNNWSSEKSLITPPSYHH